MEPFLELRCYRTLDLSGDEVAQPIENFKPLYQLAKANGLRLKAHVGEWGDADSVRRAVEELSSSTRCSTESQQRTRRP